MKKRCAHGKLKHPRGRRVCKKAPGHRGHRASRAASFHKKVRAACRGTGSATSLRYRQCMGTESRKLAARYL